MTLSWPAPQSIVSRAPSLAEIVSLPRADSARAARGPPTWLDVELAAAELGVPLEELFVELGRAR
jgi:hypothetical protein